MAPQSSARAEARDPARLYSARLPARRPPDHLCGLGYSPADPRQSHAEGEVCLHAERLLNMVHAYCEFRDSWTGWLRSGAMGRTLFERIVPEMRDLQGAERRIVDQPSVTLLAVLDYAARARQAVPTYTPLKTIDYPQPPVSAQVREACERLTAEAAEAALAARQAGARAYAARMTSAIERERAEEARRHKAMAGAGVTESPGEAARATSAVEARIAVYERERRRVLAEAGLQPNGAGEEEAPKDNPAPGAGQSVTWQVHARRLGKTILNATPEFAPGFAPRLILVDRGKHGGVLRALGAADLAERLKMINGVPVRLVHRRSLTARLRRDGVRYEARLTPAQVRSMRLAESPTESRGAERRAGA